MRRILTFLLACCFGFIPHLLATGAYAQSGDLSVTPDGLNVGTFFSGGKITISGNVPNGQDVFVEVVGPSVESQFDVKGRLGPLWMTRGKAELDGAPTLYALLLPSDHPDVFKTASSLGLGLDKLRDKISIHTTTMNTDDIYQMFLDLKKSEELYIEKENAVTYTSSERHPRQFSAIFNFPSSTVAGEYTIKITSVENREKRLVQTHPFLVKEIGFIRLVNDMATDRRLLYGILAVVIALFAGAVMGFLFKGGGGH